jgi:hypothetical protein
MSLSKFHSDIPQSPDSFGYSKLFKASDLSFDDLAFLDAVVSRSFPRLFDMFHSFIPKYKAKYHLYGKGNLQSNNVQMKDGRLFFPEQSIVHDIVEVIGIYQHLNMFPNINIDWTSAEYFDRINTIKLVATVSKYETVTMAVTFEEAVLRAARVKYINVQEKKCISFCPFGIEYYSFLMVDNGHPVHQSYNDHPAMIQWSPPNGTDEFDNYHYIAWFDDYQFHRNGFNPSSLQICNLPYKHGNKLVEMKFLEEGCVKDGGIPRTMDWELDSNGRTISVKATYETKCC